jgi:hypothetical protein
VRALTAVVRKSRNRDTSQADAWARRLRRNLSLVLEAADGPVPEGISPSEAASLDRAILEVRRRLQTTLGAVRGIRSVAV